MNIGYCAQCGGNVYQSNNWYLEFGRTKNKFKHARNGKYLRKYRAIVHDTCKREFINYSTFKARDDIGSRS